MMELQSGGRIEFRLTGSAPALRERLLVAVLLLATAAEACAEERPRVELRADPRLGTGPAMVRLPVAPPARIESRLIDERFAAPTDAMAPPRFSATDFTARKHSIFDRDDPEGDPTPALRTTNLWQRMGDYRSHDRVRVLTLWQSTGSAVSLQAGKHGDPSLQWTSNSLNRGGATRGLLDKLFSVSITGAAQSLRSVTHAKTPAAAGSGAMVAELK